MGQERSAMDGHRHPGRGRGRRHPIPSSASDAAGHLTSVCSALAGSAFYCLVVASTSDRDRLMAVRVDPLGFLRLTWVPGLRIDGPLADAAMALIDEMNAGRERPLLVDMAGTAQLTREARMAFARKCSASRIALVGRSEVDRVIANFALGVSGVPVPTRFFTSEAAAVTWLCGVDARS